MKTIDQQLYDYIDAQQDCEHMTSKGILISAPDMDWLKAEYAWINIAHTSLAVSFCSPMTDFVKTFGIRNISDIHTLAPGMILELYYEGLAEMVCFICLSYLYCMSFKKLGNIIVAENDRGYKHNIPAFVKLETPDQYISYTTEYYKLIECNEN